MLLVRSTPRERLIELARMIAGAETGDQGGTRDNAMDLNAHIDLAG